MSSVKPSGYCTWYLNTEATHDSQIRTFRDGHEIVQTQAFKRQSADNESSERASREGPGGICFDHRDAL